MTPEAYYGVLHQTGDGSKEAPVDVYPYYVSDKVYVQAIDYPSGKPVLMYLEDRPGSKGTLKKTEEQQKTSGLSEMMSDRKLMAILKAKRWDW